MITLISSLFKPVNMRSPNFRNGVTWSYTGYKAHFNCSLLYHHNTRTNELLKHQKWDKLIFQQPEHLICTKKYLYHFGVNLHSWWIPPIRQNDKISSPAPEKSKTIQTFASQYNYIYVFSTNEWHLHTYYGIAGTFFMIWLKLWNLVRF